MSIGKSSMPATRCHTGPMRQLRSTNEGFRAIGGGGAGFANRHEKTIGRQRHKLVVEIQFMWRRLRGHK